MQTAENSANAVREIRRRRYLQAMGIDGYVSRCPLPGAAPSRRLVIAVPAGERPAPGATAVQSPGAAPMPPGVLQETLRSRPEPARSPASQPAPPAADAGGRPIDAFSVAAIALGGWLWLEELEHGVLAREQLQMIRGMALAVSREAADNPPAVNQFDWPIHRNTQFDLGDEAAGAGLRGFIVRQLEQHGCAGIVLLGESCDRRLGDAGADLPRRIRTVSTAAMLHDPALKRRAWKDLQALLASP